LIAQYIGGNLLIVGTKLCQVLLTTPIPQGKYS